MKARPTRWIVYAYSTAFGGSCVTVEADRVDLAITRAIMRHNHLDYGDIVRVETDKELRPRWERRARRLLGGKKGRELARLRPPALGGPLRFDDV